MSEKFLSGSGGSLANGLNFKEKITDSPDSLGMGRASKKKNQVPKSPPVGTSKRK
jgi:hypothetical protein